MADTLHSTIGRGILKPRQRKIMLVAGEESGDIYAGRLISQLRDRMDNLAVEGIGGQRMREAGGATFYDIAQMSSVGVSSMLGCIGFFLKVLREMKQKISSGEYEALIIIDYPDFNMRLAKAADAAGIPVFYYVAPQFWAWRSYRIHAVKRWVDMMFVVFPFEEEFYKGWGVPARFSGHPILDELQMEGLDREALRAEFGAHAGQILLGLLPGSRNGEVNRMFPLMLDAVKIIRATKPVKIVAACADSVDLGMMRRLAQAAGDDPLIVKGRTWEVMNACDFLLCKSGTSTLQAAIAGTPMAIVYKSDTFSYMLAKSLAHVKWAGLPNLVAGREIAPELIQWSATPQNVAAAALPYLTSQAKRDHMRGELGKIRLLLGGKGAAGRAADNIAGFLQRLRNP
ncbi:MAG: lipid-A-disaccharide synthase [Nitrospinae bacterium]|nr:lipid-A-disaccharide synthase [Nitrospinota bacterium]